MKRQIKTIDDVLKEESLSPEFKTLFHGCHINGNEYDAVFSSFTDTPGLLPEIPFIKKMNELGVVLFLHGQLVRDYLLTRTHLLEYSLIDHWSIVNAKAKYDGSDTWECTWGELKKVVPLTKINHIEIYDNSRFHSWEAKTVQKEGDPLKGAIVGGILGGSTGALIGAVANSGKREVMIAPGGSTTFSELLIEMSADRYSFEKMIAASYSTMTRSNTFQLRKEYQNKINNALTLGIKLPVMVSSPEQLGSSFLNKIEGYVNSAKEAIKRREEAHSYWNMQFMDQVRLEETLECLQKDYGVKRKQLEQEVDILKNEINVHLVERVNDLESAISQLDREIQNAWLMKKHKLKKERDELQHSLQQYKNALLDETKTISNDEFIWKKRSKINELKDKASRFEEVINGFLLLRDDISSYNQKEYLKMFLDPDFNPENLFDTL